jgi:predicted kinase
MSTLYVLIGPPGVGKSTWTLKHLRQTDCPTRVVSSDNIIEETAMVRGLTYSEAWNVVDQKWIGRQVNDDFARAIAEGGDIIIDRTSMSKKSRRSWLSRVPKSYQTVAVVFRLDRAILQERLDRRARETGKIIPLQAVDDMLARFEEPDLEEFDAIMEIVGS